jgi:hypothetical protein
VTVADLEQMRRDRNRRLERLRKRRNMLAQLNGIDISYVDAEPIRRHINRLVALGWSHEALAAQHGNISRSALRLVAAGRSRKASPRIAGALNIPHSLAVPNTVPDDALVPSAGVTRRVRALLALGWRHEDLTEYAGRSLAIFASNTAPHSTRAIDWRVVAAVYEQLSMSRGPSGRTATTARRNGYAPPLAYNDIDDPTKRPVGVAA